MSDRKDTLFLMFNVAISIPTLIHGWHALPAYAWLLLALSIYLLTMKALEFGL